MPQLPLTGVRVVVTRSAEQASTLARALTEQGAEVLEVPTITIGEPADGGAALRAAVVDLERYDWVVVTSTNGAARLVDAVRGPWLTTARVAAIGAGTCDELSRLGIPVDLVPDRFVAEGLLAAFPDPPDGGGTVLVAQAAGARPVLVDGLRDAGWIVDMVEAYRTTHPPVAPELARAVAGADVVTFTSASTVAGFVGALGVDGTPRVVACIGPVTAAAARELGLTVDAIAEPHTIGGLVDAIVTHLGART